MINGEDTFEEWLYLSGFKKVLDKSSESVYYADPYRFTFCRNIHGVLYKCNFWIDKMDVDTCLSIWFVDGNGSIIKGIEFRGFESGDYLTTNEASKFAYCIKMCCQFVELYRNRKNVCNEL